MTYVDPSGLLDSFSCGESEDGKPEEPCSASDSASVSSTPLDLHGFYDFLQHAGFLISAQQYGTVAFAFVDNLFSKQYWKNELSDGGCVNVFIGATADALNPFSPSLSSAGEGAAVLVAANKYNAAVRYAAAQTNYLGGTGLLYPMNSSVVRATLAESRAAGVSGLGIAADLAIVQGLATEIASAATGQCH
jgi:hypothetical protein